ncbi:MAG: hypothetical protein ACRDRU_02815 [Pseudonocardiaceae bacterium]
MASTSTPKLQIKPNPTNFDLIDFQIDYDIFFTPFDIKTDLPYGRVVAVFGVDVNVGDPQPDAGPDDMLSAKFLGTVSAGGAAVKHQTDVISLSRATTDEDKPPISNPDELQVKVEITPQLPFQQSVASNIVTVNLP